MKELEIQKEKEQKRIKDIEEILAVDSVLDDKKSQQKQNLENSDIHYLEAASEESKQQDSEENILGSAKNKYKEPEQKQKDVSEDFDFNIDAVEEDKKHRQVDQQ